MSAAEIGGGQPRETAGSWLQTHGDTHAAFTRRLQARAATSLGNSLEFHGCPVALFPRTGLGGLFWKLPQQWRLGSALAFTPTPMAGGLRRTLSKNQSPDFIVWRAGPTGDPGPSAGWELLWASSSRKELEGLQGWTFQVAKERPPKTPLRAFDGMPPGKGVGVVFSTSARAGWFSICSCLFSVCKQCLMHIQIASPVLQIKKQPQIRDSTQLV